MEASILDNVDLVDLGQKLQQARKRRGLTQDEAARVIDAARTTITAIEKGERHVRASELLKLARFYQQQVNYFLRSTSSPMPFQVQFRAGLFKSEEEVERVQSAIDLFEELCRNYRELEEISGVTLARKYPPECQIGGLEPEHAGEAVAGDERNRLGIGDGGVPSLREVLEQDVGLRIFYIEIRQPKVSEMYTYTDELGGCLAINRLHPEERRRWSLAHGYAHFLLRRHTSDVLVQGSYQRLPEVERFAEAFARCFLMPADGVRRRFKDVMSTKGDVSIADLLVLASNYGVSAEALTRRLEEMRLVPTGMWDQLKERGLRVRDAQRELGLQAPVGQDQILPKRYQYLALEALDRELISEGQFAHFMRLDRLEARRAIYALRREIGTVMVDSPVEGSPESSEA